jgi:hypothetical protein
MHTVFIKFSTQDDRVRGFYELATKARIGSFPDEIYQVPVEALRLLDDQQIAYRDLKETWTARFEQLDIWITAHRIEIV